MALDGYVEGAYYFCKTVLKRFQILPELDEGQETGLIHAQIAHCYVVCPATVTILSIQMVCSPAL